MNFIRNFAIIAHVDHGKSTLADRFLEFTGVVEKGKHEEQLLDRNPVSRERGITIKLAPVRMEFRINNLELRMNNANKKIQNSEFCILNLIDTPGHADFSYEVDRTLACVEGAILLVDASQGIQAQTISNAYKAIEKNLLIIPVVNKIDLPNADTDLTKKQIGDFLGIPEEEIFAISAKTGEGVNKLLQAVIEKIPAPSLNPQGSGNPEGSALQTLIFDSYYDSHKGVIAFVRIFSGSVKSGMRVFLASNKEIFAVREVGFFTPELKQTEQLMSGEICYITTNLKDIHKVGVGDAIVNEKGSSTPLSRYKKVKPMVFVSIFSVETDEYLSLKNALEKLYLNDSSLEFSPIYSKALGSGFRVGFLGLLHADVVRERLEREFNLNLILTPAKVEFKVKKSKFDHDSKQKQLSGFLEPYIKIMMIIPEKYLGAVMQLCQSYRAKFISMDNKSQMILSYEMPMSEMISDFHDKLKSLSSGYASLDWQFLDYREVEADELILLLNGKSIAEFSEIVVRERVFDKAQILVKRLKSLIPRQQYEVKIQAQYKGKIIASERITPLRKDVTKKLYGGDRTRKDKLLEKQKLGKKKMKMVGRVEIPKEAIILPL